MASERIKYLAERFLNQTINEAEKSELANWVNHCSQDEELSGVLEQAWQKHKAVKQMPEDMSERIKALVFLEEPLKQEAESTSIHLIPYRKRSWLWIAAAGLFMIMISGIVYVKTYYPKQPVFAKKEVVPQNKADVPPGGNKAILTLSNGTQIILDSAANGLPAKQGNAELRMHTAGELAYVSTGSAATEVMYNTMRTPPGGQYKLILPDGSVVWLNAASSIRFPTAFTGKERKVTVTGEAYFEITTLSAKGGHGNVPFIVQVNSASVSDGSGDSGMEIQVLGTHFNVNAYDEEDAIKTTLLEGAVKIVMAHTSSSLLPGQQALLQKSGKIKIDNAADTEEAVAWKDGYFQFNSADLQSVLRQAARWYNLEVEFAGDVPKDRFTGKISRTVNLSRLLKWMQWSDVHFKLEGRKIIVLP